MNLNDIRGKYSGEVQLLGNASTLKKESIKEPCFGTNRIAKMTYPTFYVCTDKFVFDNYKSEVLDTISHAKLSFVPVEATLEFEGIGINPQKNRQYVTDDLNEGIYVCTSVLLPAYQLAVWMGFNPITIMGVDFYTHPEQLHFYSPEQDSMSNLPLEELGGRRKSLILAHAWMINHAERHRVELRYL